MAFNQAGLMWVVLAAALVLLMQAGFAALEAGLARPKNGAHLATTKLTTVLITVLVFWVSGYALLLGTSAHGLYGKDGFFLGGNLDGQPAAVALFCLHVVFAATAANVFLGALGERLRFEAAVALALLFTAILYPLFGHWVWGGVASGRATGWLARAGFVDFAGATVVHALGGWAALGGLLVVGNRRGRYARSGKALELAGASIPLATLGLFLVWIGGLAWMAGASLQAIENAPRVLLATLISSMSAGLTALALGIFGRGRGAPPVAAVLRAIVAGLVAISAGANALGAPQALLVGVVAALLVRGAERVLERRRIDDPVGAVSVHLSAGVWGTLAAGLLGDPFRLGTGLGVGAQVLAQLEGSAVAAVWGLGGGYALCRALALLTPLRVSPDDELSGLDVSEHHAASERMDVSAALEETARRTAERDAARTVGLADLAHLTFATEGDGLVLSASAPASAIFGYDERELRRVPLAQLFAPIRDEPLDVDSLLASLDTTPREMRGVRRTGEEFPMEVSLGAESGSLLIEDISARKESEAALTRATEAIRRRLEHELEESRVTASYAQSGERELPGGDLALLVPPGADWFGAYHDGDGRAIILYGGDVVAQATSTSALLSSALLGGAYEAEYTHGLLLGDSRYPPERQLRNLADVLNRIVSREGRGEVTLEMTFVHIDIASGNAVVLNAGRKAPTLLKSGRTIRELGGGGTALGYAGDPQLAHSQLALGPGDVLVLTGEGLVETISPDGSVLRTADLKKRILTKQTPHEVLGEVLACARAVWKDTHDRHAVLAFRWKPPLR
jgi:ammonium transporter